MAETRKQRGSRSSVRAGRPVSGWSRAAGLLASGVAMTLVGALNGMQPAAAAAPSTTISGHRLKCTIVGTSGNDRLVGTSGRDVICGRGGNDVIFGGGGNDVIAGDGGNDTIYGGDGNDVIAGGNGNDRVDAGTGGDNVKGGDGKDRIDAGAGNDKITGGGGNDTIDAGAGNDSAGGNSGNDTIDGEEGDDHLDGGSGTDHVEGGTGVNSCRPDPRDRTSCDDRRAPVMHLETAKWLRPTINNSAMHELVFQVRVTDDRSGVAGGSVTVSGGPEGCCPKQRFFLLGLGHNIVSGTPNDGIMQFTVDLPAGVPVGEWHVEGANLRDRTNRRTSLQGPSGFPTFTVTGITDTQAPVVDTASVRWDGPPTIDNRTGAEMRVLAHVTDDRAGVSDGAATLCGPNSSGIRLPFANLVSGTPTDGVWKFYVYTSSRWMMPGEYRLCHIEVQDQVGYHSGADIVGGSTVTLTGVVPAGQPGGGTGGGTPPDTTAPVIDLSSLRWVTPTVDNGRDQTLRLQMRVTDGGSGVKFVSAFVRDSSGVEAPLVTSRRLVSGTAKDGIWETTGTLPASSPSGEWHIFYLEARDVANNEITVENPANTPALTVSSPRFHGAS
ncbi:calcium-binding protein [Krasilnikovia sp. MM14-A1259]|uniref:calcium-binding protein n=1 Tax=Krasilnikovia sp. MM14-A1259 TaxID=3373539 RepID=UPI00380B963A